MTFFANSGVAWPRYEEEMRQAGAKSLDAISQTWRLFADLEGRREDVHVDTPTLFRSAESLQEASSSYSLIAGHLRGVIVDPITPAEW